MNLSKYSNPGGLTWSYTTTYWCGVNVSGASDTICASGAAPSGGPMSNNAVVISPGGRRNSITVFPMLQPTVIFSDGEHPTYKFRDWDTLSRASTTKLAASSGQGR
jgi:hypothetical protein